MTRQIEKRVINLYKEVGEGFKLSGDAFILLHDEEKDPSKPSYPNINIHRFNNSVLTDLGIKPIQDQLLPGSNHFPLIKFYLENPGYTYYWIVEDDVRFSGNWNFLFNTFDAKCDYELITSHIKYYSEEPNWFWWDSISHPAYKVPLNKRIRSFNPIYRISKDALDYIYDLLIKEWKGHHEVFLPTMLNLAGAKLLDFGGSGSFVPVEYRDMFYTSRCDDNGSLSAGTMRFRPIMKRKGRLKNKIYHPVK